jgi:carboxyl-terminal processing protease
LFLLLLPVVIFAQSEKNPCETLTKINALIQEKHYQPKPVDDSLSVYVFKTFLSQLDDDNNLFIEPEITILKKHQYQIDDYLKTSNCSFLDELWQAYNKSIDRYEKVIATIKKEPFPFSSTEVMHFSKKAFPYSKDEKEMKTAYRKRLLFDILKEVAETSKNKDSLTVNFNSIAAKSKVKIFDSYECKTSSYRLSRKDFNTKFFSVFCSYFDPHTEYFSDTEKSNFLSQVSADNLTFGLFLSINDKSEVTVDDVVPGSSAYFTEKIDAGDLLLKIKTKNEEYNITCSSMDNVSKIINSSDYKNADFTLKKKTGETYSVSLEKKIMKDYDNNVYSYILEKDGKKTGYIKIPSFYTTFENGKTNVSDDVAKEVYKLQEDHIDGLIIDLENNGGGSMDEAIKLTGQFIDIGPVAIMNDREGKKEILKDLNRGMLYSGPLVVLINGFSASASEFFTNAMQDYNRAVIVGNQSHGKASMQQILPLSEDKNPTEFVKLTLEKFYRITGKSNQKTGITPDVFIPTLFDKQMPRESSQPTALENGTIASTLRYTKVVNNNQKAIESSKKRISESVDVKKLQDLDNRINALYDTALPTIPLQFSKVFDEVYRINAIWKEIEAVNETEFPITVERNSTDVEYQQFDDYVKTNNKEKIKAIKSNLHIIEAVNIINDLKQ